MLGLLDSVEKRTKKLEKWRPTPARAKQAADQYALPAHWRNWLARFFPQYVTAGFAPRHVEFWDWVWAIERGVRPRSFIAAWPRGGAKSTSAELACSALGLRRQRRYAIYLCETQDQADKHVSTIGTMLEGAGVERAVNRYGSSRGWRRNRLKTETGFTIDALGFDTALRGAKDEMYRPDLIVLDDIDNRHDAPEAVNKKIETLTQTILPVGSPDCAVLGAQNLMHANGVFARMTDGRADFLTDRIVNGPFVALEDFAYENDFTQPRGIRITAGSPTWAGQGIAECQWYINTWGLRAFNRECQQQVKTDVEGALWRRTDMIDVHRVSSFPDLVRVVVAIDPSTTSKETSAEAGVGVAGKGLCNCKGRPEMHGFVLGDYTKRGTPNEWASAALGAYSIHKADRIVGEGNNGGEMVETVIKSLAKDQGKVVSYEMVWASRGKATRAEPVSELYAEGRVHHVGTFADLEDEMCTWIPGVGQSPNRVDWLVWAITSLGLVAPEPASATAARRDVHAQRPRSSWQRG